MRPSVPLRPGATESKAAVRLRLLEVVQDVCENPVAVFLAFETLDGNADGNGTVGSCIEADCRRSAGAAVTQPYRSVLSFGRLHLNFLIR